MDDEPRPHSFVVRVWIEDPRRDEHARRWRGHITNVLDHRRRPVGDFADIRQFIEQYLALGPAGDRRHDEEEPT